MSANFQQINIHYYLQITTYNFFCLPDKILINFVAQWLFATAIWWAARPPDKHRSIGRNVTSQ